MWLVFLSEGAGDPDAERAIQVYALLASRLRYKIEDDFPEVTLNMLTHIWPQALRPLLPTSLVQFSPQEGNHLGATTLPAGTSVFAGEISFVA
ncbi:type VI secretion system baseplate subunit TssF [Photorhabdus thracensis]|uniref:type VI secretion system baseplate subunit TssF n=1 Tax=Photorhabdus thracensis TaxID=230089 RepID=UPI0030833CB8